MTPTTVLHHRQRPRRNRATVAVLSVTTAVGLWLGSTAPSVSPVAPPPAAVVPVVPVGAAAGPAPGQVPAP